MTRDENSKRGQNPRSISSRGRKNVRAGDELSEVSFGSLRWKLRNMTWSSLWGRCWFCFCVYIFILCPLQREDQRLTMMTSFEVSWGWVGSLAAQPVDLSDYHLELRFIISKSRETGIPQLKSRIKPLLLSRLFDCLSRDLTLYRVSKRFPAS